MSEAIRDPLKTIQDALNAPIEAVEPTQFDEAAIARSMATKYTNVTLKDELSKK